MNHSTNKTTNSNTSYWSRGKLESVPRCPICGSERRANKHFSRHDDQRVMPDIWNMASCQECHTLYLDPRPDAESLPRAYQNYYTHQKNPEDQFNDKNTSLIWSLIHGYLNWRFGMQRTPSNRLGAPLFTIVEPLRLKLDYYGRHLTRQQFPIPGHLLDIGCGNGTFLTRAREMGWRVHGCEPDSKAVEVCKSLGLDVICGDAFDTQFDDQQFDVITLSHVLEHIAEPQALISRLSSLLRPGGLLWVAVPNTNSMGLKIFSNSWINLHFPYHLCIPSPAMLEKILTTSGFANIHRLRRGAHARFHWNSSREVATRENLPAPPLLSTLGVLNDLLASISNRWAEEIVITARKSSLV